jgi:DNA-binding NarL/FixJ family response regulator
MSTVSYALPRPPSIARRMPAPNRILAGQRWLLPAQAVSNRAPAPDFKPNQTSIKVLVAAENSDEGDRFETRLDRDNIHMVGATSHYHKMTALAAELQPDVVIISFNLAMKTGLELVRRNLSQICGARLLVLTPHTDHAFGEHIAASGAAGFIHDQTCAELLAAAVREVHENKENFFPRGFTRHASVEYQPLHGQTPCDKNTTDLTAREREVLQHIAAGNANKQTASKLGISIKTVEKHRQRLMDKLHIHETATLTRYALYAGIAR